jgi:signal transduction histidine kinase
MAADVRARAFEPFFTTRAFGEGGGSGLAIARGIFESHGGTITIDDAVAAGCSVVVTLPIAKGEAR